jgi:shikimate dehydrogenase
LPVKADWLTPDMAVGDVITVPEITPLLATARRIGCITSTGVAMFTAGRDLIVDFLLGT